MPHIALEKFRRKVLYNNYILTTAKLPTKPKKNTFPFKTVTRMRIEIQSDSYRIHIHTLSSIYPEGEMKKGKKVGV
jgi:hypothetical protein